MKSLFFATLSLILIGCSESSDEAASANPPQEEQPEIFQYDYELSRIARKLLITWSGIPEILWAKIQFCVLDETQINNCSLLKEARFEDKNFVIKLGEDLNLSTLITMMNASPFILLLNESNEVVATHEITITQDLVNSSIQYIKASNGFEGDKFGFSAAISSDGKTVAIGSPFENSQEKKSYNR